MKFDIRAEMPDGGFCDFTVQAEDRAEPGEPLLTPAFKVAREYGERLIRMSFSCGEKFTWRGMVVFVDREPVLAKGLRTYRIPRLNTLSEVKYPAR